MLRITVLGLATTALVLGVARPAFADEGESSLSVGIGAAGFSVPDHSGYGGLLGGDYQHGLTDLIWLRASGGGGVLYDTSEEAPTYAGYGNVGITYVLDVLKYVPHVDLGVGAIALLGNDYDSPVTPVVSVGAGVDMLTSRTRSSGIFVRYDSFLGRSALFQLGIRTSWRWGFF